MSATFILLALAVMNSSEYIFTIVTIGAFVRRDLLFDRW